jgi:SAM-dependent methyltransferase
MKLRAHSIWVGLKPKNRFKADEVYGVDIRTNGKIILLADLSVEPIPFEDNFLDYCSAFDFLAHVPRIIYAPQRGFCFVELISEIFRVLKPRGRFFSFTPAFPAPAAWRDPTHVNINISETFPLYSDNKNALAKMYDFKGVFIIEKQSLNQT